MNICSFKTKMLFNQSKKSNFGAIGVEKHAVEQPPSGKPKISEVTSIYRENMIQLSQVHLSPNKGCYVGVV